MMMRSPSGMTSRTGATSPTLRWVQPRRRRAPRTADIRPGTNTASPVSATAQRMRAGPARRGAPLVSACGGRSTVPYVLSGSSAAISVRTGEARRGRLGCLPRSACGGDCWRIGVLAPLVTSARLSRHRASSSVRTLVDPRRPAAQLPVTSRVRCLSDVVLRDLRGEPRRGPPRGVALGRRDRSSALPSSGGRAGLIRWEADSSPSSASHGPSTRGAGSATSGKCTASVRDNGAVRRRR